MIDKEVDGSMIAPIDGAINEEVDGDMSAPIDAAIDEVDGGANIDV